MNEREFQSELDKLQEYVKTHFDNLREKLWEEEQSLFGLIEGIKSNVDSKLNEQIDNSYKEFKHRNTRR